MKHLKLITSIALFVALGVLMPVIFHFFGAVSGQTFLPMHIPVLIAGLVVSPTCGLAVGFLSPMLSCFLTNMPAFFKMPFMCIELSVYGLTAGFFVKLLSKKMQNKTAPIYLSLLLSQICGRIANLVCTYLAINLLGISNQAISVQLCLLSIPIGFAGIAIQWIFIPPIARILRLKTE